MCSCFGTAITKLVASGKFCELCAVTFQAAGFADEHKDLAAFHVATQKDMSLLPVFVECQDPLVERIYHGICRFHNKPGKLGQMMRERRKDSVTSFRTRRTKTVGLVVA